MYENPEMNVSSAQQLWELNQKRKKEALQKEAATNKITQLMSEQVSLLKESSEIDRKSHAKAGVRSKQETDLVDIKPNFCGLGVNLNEVWRRFKKWFSK